MLQNGWYQTVILRGTVVDGVVRRLIGGWWSHRCNTIGSVDEIVLQRFKVRRK